MKRSSADTIELWPLTALKPHPENIAIFGGPDDCSEHTLGALLASIEEDGIREPILTKADGTILAGHLRHACADMLGMTEIPVRVFTPASYAEELKLVICSNTDRRRLTKQEIARAYRKLKDLSPEDGGARATLGRPRKNEKSVQRGQLFWTRTKAARLLGVGWKEAEACALVFLTDGVPEALRAAVNANKVPATRAARAIRRELERQGGRIARGDALVALARGGESGAARSLVERLGAIERTLATTLEKMPLRGLGVPEYREACATLRRIVARANGEVVGVQVGDGRPRLRLVHRDERGGT